MLVISTLGGKTLVLGCMVLYNTSITSLTKSFVLRSLFQEDDLEIEVKDKGTTVIYLWNVSKERIWQATVMLESANLTTVYHFAESKSEALSGALVHLRPTLAKA